MQFHEPRCRACTSPHRLEIEAAARGCMPCSEIERRFGIPAKSAARHMRLNHDRDTRPQHGQVARETEAVAELESLKDRLFRQLDLAEAEGDRMAVAILGQSLAAVAGTLDDQGGLRDSKGKLVRAVALAKEVARVQRTMRRRLLSLPAIREGVLAEIERMNLAAPNRARLGAEA